MGIFRTTRSKKSVSIVRIISAVLVLGVLVLLVAESAKYLYVARVPKSVSSKIDPSLEKLAAVLGAAKTSLNSLEDIGSVFTSDEDGGGATKREDAVGTKQVSVNKVIQKIGILSDSHNDLDKLREALTKVKSLEVDRVMFLGDYTDWGEEKNLIKAKEVMDRSGLEYISLPGDHDLGETRDDSNFAKVFGNTHGVWEQAGTKCMFFDNSKNYTKIPAEDMAWFKSNINDIRFLFLSQPLETSDMSRVMGIIDGVRDEAVFAQNLELLTAVRSSEVRVIISGDLHRYSHFVDPIRNDLQHYTVGAILKSQSLEKRNLQSPRFAVLTVFSDNSYTMDDMPID